MNTTELQPGDVLLFRPSGILGRLVAWATGSEYGHVAMFLGTSGKTVAEMREFIGGRILPLTNYATETIDVFRPDTAEWMVRFNAIMAMYRVLGEPYSLWHGVAAFLLRRIPKRLRKLFRFECDHHGYHCSQSISKAYRDAGFDLCPGRPDWATTPGDLAKSKRLKNLGQLEC